MRRRPPWWRLTARREWDFEQRMTAARVWQRASWEWSQVNPGVPVMEALITRDGTSVVWNGPRLTKPENDE